MSKGQKIKRSRGQKVKRSQRSQRFKGSKGQKVKRSQKSKGQKEKTITSKQVKQTNKVTFSFLDLLVAPKNGQILGI